MSLIDQLTPVIAHPALDLFQRVPLQNTILETKTETLLPFTQLNTGSNYEFRINTAYNEFIALNKTRLRIEFRVKLAKSDGSAVAATDWNNVSVVNNLIHSMFSQIDVFFGDTPTTSALQTYPYRAYIETLLETPKRVMDTWKYFSMYTDDDMGSSKMDLPNEGRISRIKATTAPYNTGKLVSLNDTLFTDPMRFQNDLVGGMDVKIRLIPSRPEFIFMTNDTKIIPSIEFTRIELDIVKHYINGDFVLGLLNGLNTTGAKYPCTRTEVRSYTIDTGTTSKNIDNMIIGQMPKRFCVAFVNNQAFSGSFTKNPYYFGNYKIDYLQAYVNGDPIRSTPYTPDFDNDIFDREYIELQRISGNLNQNSMNALTPSKWKYGYTNLSPDQSDTFEHGFISDRTQGYLKLQIRFKEALTSTINCLVFCKFENQITIDSLHNTSNDAT